MILNYHGVPVILKKWYCARMGRNRRQGLPHVSYGPPVTRLMLIHGWIETLRIESDLFTLGK